MSASLYPIVPSMQQVTSVAKASATAVAQTLVKNAPSVTRDQMVAASTSLVAKTAASGIGALQIPQATGVQPAAALNIGAGIAIANYGAAAGGSDSWLPIIFPVVGFGGFMLVVGTFIGLRDCYKACNKNRKQSKDLEMQA